MKNTRKSLTDRSKVDQRTQASSKKHFKQLSWFQVDSRKPNHSRSSSKVLKKIRVKASSNHSEERKIGPFSLGEALRSSTPFYKFSNALMQQMGSKKPVKNLSCQDPQVLSKNSRQRKFRSKIRKPTLPGHKNLTSPKVWGPPTQISNINLNTKKFSVPPSKGYFYKRLIAQLNNS